MMFSMRFSQFFPLFGLLLISFCLFSDSAVAQKRDDLTETEANLVRDTQELDKRTEIFVKFIDRRLLVINNPTAVEPKKDAEKFGALPKGTRAELLSDIARILDEAMTKIDDVANRDEKNPLIPKALKIFAAACSRFLPEFNSLREKATDAKEIGALGQAIENAEAVVDANQNFGKTQ